MGSKGQIHNVSDAFQSNVKLQSEKGEEYSLDLSDMLMTAISKMTYKTQLNDLGRIHFKIRNSKNEMLIWKNVPWKKRSF